MAVRVPHARAEEARAAMLELFPEGFEEREDASAVELAAYTSRAGEERLRRALGDVRSESVEPGWAEGWKRFHRPVRVGPLWVGPPWERPDAGATSVVIDPGQAFGTGGHPTTRLCLQLLLGQTPTSLVDCGCGSGVLAIAAAKLGFRPVVALDLDEAAVGAARTNAALNGVEIDVRPGDVRTDPLPAAELGIANIALPELELLTPRLGSRALIASGYLVADRPRFAGWRAVERLELEGWAAERLERF